MPELRRLCLQNVPHKRPPCVRPPGGSPMMITLLRGHRVRVRALGLNKDWCEAEVLIASKNGLAVALDLLGSGVWVAGGIIGGVLPLIIDPVAETITGLTGDLFELDVRSDQTTWREPDPEEEMARVREALAQPEKGFEALLLEALKEGEHRRGKRNRN